MLMHRPGNKDRGEERKHISLQKCHEQFQTTNEDLPDDTAERHEAPHRRILPGRNGDESQNDGDHGVTTHNVGK